MSLPFYVPPEQLMKDRAEYSRKGIARGRSILSLAYVNGLLIMGENTSGALYKISEIYDRIAFAGVGKYNEFEALRVAGIRHADVKGYAYGRTDVTAKSLANAYSQTLGHIFTTDVKPYEVEILVLEVGAASAGNRMFRVTYDGTLSDETDYCAIGGQTEQILGLLEQRYQGDLELSAAIQLGVGVFEEIAKRTVPGDEWEVAVLDRTNGRRTFRRLSPTDIESARG